MLSGFGALVLAFMPAESATDITVFATSCPHYGKPGDEYAVNRAAMVPFLNALPGKAYPSSVGGGPIAQPNAVMALGDLTESPKADQWANYVADYGVNGEGKLKWPVYDALGNHEEPPKDVITAPFKARNRLRKNVFLDTSAYFYSWDWGQVHFVNLNLYSGTTRGTGTGHPMGALYFLKEDLEKRVGTSGRPVIVVQHYQFDNGDSWWQWTQKELTLDILKKYNVVALIHGHSHAKNYYKWQGIDVLDVGSTMKGDVTVLRIKETRLFAVNLVKEAWGTLKLDKTISLGKPLVPSSLPSPFARARNAAAQEFVFSVAGNSKELRAAGDFDQVEVLDLFGKRVRRLTAHSGGLHWDRKDEKGMDTPRGIYFLKLTGKKSKDIKKLILE